MTELRSACDLMWFDKWRFWCWNYM